MLEKLRSLFASAPKTLPQATATLTEATAQLETLAAELTTRDERITALTAELAEAEKQGETATAELATIKARAETFEGVLAQHGEIFKEMGFIADGQQKPKEAFETHVAKATTLALAKTGHPPAHVPAAVDTAAAPTDGKALLAAYEAMAKGPERQAFFAKHETAIWAAHRAREASAE